MPRIFCPIFDTDLDRREKHQPLCQVHKYNRRRCKECQIEYYKMTNKLMYTLIKGMAYFTIKSSYYFNGQTIPNDGCEYLTQKAEKLLEDILWQYKKTTKQ